MKIASETTYTLELTRREMELLYAAVRVRESRLFDETFEAEGVEAGKLIAEYGEYEAIDRVMYKELNK